VLALSAACTLAACATSQPQQQATPSADQVALQQVAPGVAANVGQPTADPSGVIVLLVPGGGWVSADPSGLAPLAAYLADRGATVVSISYRTSSDGFYFPVPVQDVGCGLAYAATQAAGVSTDAVTLAVVGHSAGAHLAAVAALDPEQSTGPDCPFQPHDADSLIGLAGPYDVVAASGQAQLLFGPESPDPTEWDDGNPLRMATNRPTLPVLLVHGAADDLVPLSFSEEFAAALTAGGHPVELEVVDAVDHMSVFGEDVAGPLIADWLGLAAPSP
jgi:acetyl esterase/lipase